MRRPAKGICVFILCIISLSMVACQGYQRQVVPFKMPSAYPNAVDVSDTTIAAKSYDDGKEAESVFGFDIVGAGVKPLQVIFDNKGWHSLEIIPDQTFIVDTDNNLWPILESRLVYDRIEKKTDLGRVAPEAAKYGVLSGIAGAMLGAAVGIVSGRNVGSTAASGAALGAAAGAVIGGTKGLADTEVKGRIRADLQKQTLENRAILPGDIAYGFLFFPGESGKAKELRLRLKEKDTGVSYTLTMQL